MILHVPAKRQALRRHGRHLHCWTQHLQILPHPHYWQWAVGACDVKGSDVEGALDEMAAKGADDQAGTSLWFVLW